MKKEQLLFLEKVARAAFANPFAESRCELDMQIGGVPVNAPEAERLAAVMQALEAEMVSLRATGHDDISRFSGSQQQIVKNAYLFYVFHRHLEDFDGLIQEQIKAGAESCKVPFARQTITEIRGFGFSEAEALRYLAVFYQLRRAYFFIREGLVGESPSMRELRMHLWNSVFTCDAGWYDTHFWSHMEDFSLLLLGETGTGKGAAAAAVGRSGFIPFDKARGCFVDSFTRSFVSINLSQYSEGVLESELFGHKRGSFTGAVENHEGVFSRCPRYGLIFLDEIGDVSLQVQVKLLQVLQERTFYPVGSHEAKRFNGRVIAATNRPLNELCLSGAFRDDLYYRLCSDEITLPPLRQRIAEEARELDALLFSILRRITGTASMKEVEQVKLKLEASLGVGYRWDGNVRELEQAAKRIILTGAYAGRAAGTVAPGLSGLAQRMESGAIDAETLLKEYCQALYQQFGTYEEVSRRMRLDRRTVKKYLS